jgi:hypothetical protein
LPVSVVLIKYTALVGAMADDIGVYSAQGSAYFYLLYLKEVYLPLVLRTSP